MFVGKFSGAHLNPAVSIAFAYAHVPPGPVPPPDPDAPAGELGFTFDRSGYRVPAILVSPWVPKGSVFNDEYRHTSLIATLRKTWNLGEAFTQRDASARTFDDLFTLQTPHDPETWVNVTALPVPAWHPRRRSPRQRAQRPRREHGHGIIETRPGSSGSSSRHNSTTPPPNPHLRTSSKSSDRSPDTTSPSSPRTAQSPATQPAPSKRRPSGGARLGSNQRPVACEARATCRRLTYLQGF